MISINQMSFAYHNTSEQVIKDMSFNIQKGEIFGFLGPSGAGKTTTQRLIIGLLRNYQGSIHIMGKERSEWGKDLYEHIGVAFDFPNLYLKLTAEENLKLKQKYYKNQMMDIEKLLSQVGLLKDRNTRVDHFSKGMKMRLNFIRSILHNPDIVFLDEPTAGLDPVNAKIIREMILSMKAAGKTIFLTTHNMNVAEVLCDQVAFLNEGKISAIDTPKNLMVNHGERFLNVETQEEGRVSFRKFPLLNLSENQDFQDLLKSNQIRTMHTEEATLEEVFIHYTGRGL